MSNFYRRLESILTDDRATYRAISIISYDKNNGDNIKTYFFQREFRSLCRVHNKIECGRQKWAIYVSVWRKKITSVIIISRYNIFDVNIRVWNFFSLFSYVFVLFPHNIIIGNSDIKFRFLSFRTVCAFETAWRIGNIDTRPCVRTWYADARYNAFYHGQ